jgi:translocation and assembly module TamA
MTSRFCAILLAFNLWSGLPASAADPQSYDLTIDNTGTAALDAALKTGSLLDTLRTSAPVSPFGLLERARQDIDRFQTVLQGFGYYLAQVTVTIADHNPDDPALLAILDAIPNGRPVSVRIRITPGPLYHLRRVEIDGAVPADTAKALKLAPGDPAIASEVLAARTRLLSALQEAGYPLAQVSEPSAAADDMSHVLDITFKVDPGRRAVLGDLTFSGLKTVNGEFVRRVIAIRPGDPYQPSKLEAARQALLATGVFAGVVIRPGDRVSPEGSIPLLFDVEERPLHAVKLEGSYSTDLGVMLSAGWSHRNLFGNAEQLNLVASGTGLWGDATKDLGYQLSAQFIKPSFLFLQQSLEFDVAGVRQDLIAYRQTLESGVVRLNWTFPPVWTGSAGISFMNDHVAQEGFSRTYQLLALPLTVGYDRVGLAQPLLDPTHGYRASIAIAPTQSFGARYTMFFILQAATSAYFALSDDGRSVIAARALAGAVLGASNLDLPPDQRLYAGGSTTVRGYRYQSIGPQFPDGKPVGGTAVDAASIEFRQRIFADWGIAAFIDAGQASAQSVPFTGTLRAGAGGGVRYYTAIGAVRADVAVPLNPPRGADAFEVYVGLGQAF